MIKNIKVFGERNSGTTFINLFLKYNIENINVLNGKYNANEGGWKHGFPDINLFKKKNQTLFIFIIRDLHQWLNSMYHKPYHYDKVKNVNKFLYEKLIIKEKRVKHPVITDPRESQNIIDLRNAKIESYLNFFEMVDNAIFINLEDIQKDKKKFINFLSETYNLSIKNNINTINTHTKTKKQGKITNKYSDVIPDEIIGKNLKIENFVDDLKKNYYYKKNI
jgi:hypothetical protein